jgi:hypothetical protein
MKAKRQRTSSKTVGQPELVRSGKNMLFYNPVHTPKQDKQERKEKAKQQRFSGLGAKIKEAFAKL